MLVLVRLAQMLGGEILMWIVAVGLGGVRVLVGVLIPRCSNPPTRSMKLCVRW
jgi:hypothetical protein